MRKEITAKIYKQIGEAKVIASPITPASNLYMDLGFDSLGFVSLLLEIEKIFSIKFELLEMSECVKVERLIDIVCKKITERGEDDKTAT